MFEKYTAYQPVRTTTTTSTWRGWQIVNPKCLKCAHCAMRGGSVACWCVSRTIDSDGTCLSYNGGDAE